MTLSFYHFICEQKCQEKKLTPRNGSGQDTLFVVIEPTGFILYGYDNFIHSFLQSDEIETKASTSTTIINILMNGATTIVKMNLIQLIILFRRLHECFELNYYNNQGFECEVTTRVLQFNCIVAENQPKAMIR